jgi:hypothetical protein
MNFDQSLRDQSDVVREINRRRHSPKAFVYSHSFAEHSLLRNISPSD